MLLNDPSGAFVLRPLDPVGDAPALQAIWGDEESCRYLQEPAFATVAETAAFLAASTAGFEDTSWAVASDSESKALGRIAFFDRGRHVWEVACMIAPAARGKKLAVRALALAIDHIFDARGARRIFADIDPDNVASIRTFVRLGFVREGLLRAQWETHLGVRDSIIMGLTKFDPRPSHSVVVNR
ncbi:MAG: GNAT family N-acetyltransferase [Parvularculaceae bacterium]|jgi:RimJ/RimL family protein N-acetyltransferase|nr:GNAT family N-acetyltransferase [Parvularculaceae bacterium]